MATPDRPNGASLARGFYAIPASEMSDIVETLMESQAMIVSAQRKLSQARFHPGWDGTSERRRDLKIQNGAYHRNDEALA